MPVSDVIYPFLHFVYYNLILLFSATIYQTKGDVSVSCSWVIWDFFQSDPILRDLHPVSFCNRIFQRYLLSRKCLNVGLIFFRIYTLVSYFFLKILLLLFNKAHLIFSFRVIYLFMAYLTYYLYGFKILIFTLFNNDFPLNNMYKVRKQSGFKIFLHEEEIMQAKQSSFYFSQYSINGIKVKNDSCCIYTILVHLLSSLYGNSIFTESNYGRIKINLFLIRKSFYTFIRCGYASLASVSWIKMTQLRRTLRKREKTNINTKLPIEMDGSKVSANYSSKGSEMGFIHANNMRRYFYVILVKTAEEKAEIKDYVYNHIRIYLDIKPSAYALLYILVLLSNIASISENPTESIIGSLIEYLE
uniref:LAGLIDADG_2 domain-containing protein n=1 Tax=Heterorhabditis bacteriophora TaxID=37862 RepID=A0A1I7W6U2_HETBA